MVEVVSFRKAFRVSNARGRIVKLLYEQDIVTPQEIAEVAPSVRTTMHYLRAVLKGYNVEVQSRPNLGYWFDNETKERVKGILDGVLPGQGEKAVIPPSSQPDTVGETPVASG